MNRSVLLQSAIGVALWATIAWILWPHWSAFLFLTLAVANVVYPVLKR